MDGAARIDQGRRAVTWPGGVGLVVAMVLALQPISPVHAVHETPAARGVEEACPPERIPGPAFQDIDGNPHEAAIACVAAWDIAEGRTPTRYAPADHTRRDEMASFVARLLAVAGVDVPWDAPPAFGDVPAGNTHFQAVNALAQLGVVTGFADDTFRPAAGVRRDQMASFISRSAEHTLGEALEDDHQWFADVLPANAHFAAVNGLAAVGIVQGRQVQARLYEPRLAVRRDAMASFLARTLDLLAAEGVVTPPDAETAQAPVRSTEGVELGRVHLTERLGGVHVRASFDGLPAGGFHGFHIHGTGACDPDFGAAGGHHNPDEDPHAHHAGDLPVLLATDDGRAVADFVTDRITIEGLLDDDGSAFIIHAAPDNYANIPLRYAPDGPDEMTLATGDAGARIGCGVVEPSAGPVLAVAPPPPDARATVVSTEGAVLGRLSFAQQPGWVEAWGAFQGLPPGDFHGFHLHGTGACDPDFTAAGGHHNPEGQPHGHHAGDLPVLMVKEDGTARTRFITDRVTVNELLAGDGSAVIIHAAPDNYANIPERYAPGGPDEATMATGDAGDRLACGVVRPRSG